MTGNPKISDAVWKAIFGRVRGLKHARVKVGVVGSAAREEEDGTTLAEIAAIHEFGAPAAGIPERSFLRSTFRNPQKLEQLRKLQARLARDLIAGKIDVARAMGLLGAWGAGAVKATITRDGEFAPLKPSTIAKKGSSRPLIDSGQLLNSISWVVVA